MRNGDITRSRPPESRETSPVENSRGLGSGIRVLVAEDTEINRDVVLAILDEMGCENHVVANGAEALSALQHENYDLVLMDCQMPEMDGYEATRRIRDYRTGVRNPEIPIIAVTADSELGAREECFAAGMDSFLSKPLQARQLAEVLSRLGIFPGPDKKREGRVEESEPA